jgi:DNA-binding beta-propeller fold protein YncE
MIKPRECYALIAFVTASLLTGCAGFQAAPTAQTPRVDAGLAPAAVSGELFVAAGHRIRVYPSGVRDPQPSGTISAGVYDPWMLAVDKGGTLYVQNNNSTITEYAGGNNTVTRTLTEPSVSGPGYLTVDGNGTVYAGNTSSGQVYVFAGSATLPTLTLNASANTGLAIDSKNNLLVGYSYCYSRAKCGTDVEKFAPGSTTGRNLHLELDAGIAGLAVDSKGNLLVGELTKPDGEISVFHPNHREPFRTFTIAEWPWQFALDNRDKYLYLVGGSYPYQDKVYVYDYRTGANKWIVTKGVPGITHGVALSPTETL